MKAHAPLIGLAIACGSISAAVSLFLGSGALIAFLVFLLAALVTIVAGPTILGVGE